MVYPDLDNSESFSRDEGTEQSFDCSNKRISIRLDDTNFLVWKQQVKLMMRDHDYLDDSISPPSKLITNDAGERVSNPAYFRFIKQDSSLASWLLSTINPDILPHLVGAETIASIWKTISGLYSQLSTTKLMHLHCRLRSIKKGDLSMRAYTMQIKEISDLLASCGSSVSVVEQIATILNGLPPVYDPFVAVISASRKPYTVEGVVSVLIDAETRIADPLCMSLGINNTRFTNDRAHEPSHQLNVLAQIKINV